MSLDATWFAESVVVVVKLVVEIVFTFVVDGATQLGEPSKRARLTNCTTRYYSFIIKSYQRYHLQTKALSES